MTPASNRIRGLPSVDRAVISDRPSPLGRKASLLTSPAFAQALRRGLPRRSLGEGGGFS